MITNHAKCGNRRIVSAPVVDRFSDILRNAVVVDPRAAWTSRSLVRRMNEDVSHVSSVVDGSVLGAVDASSRLVYDQMIDHAWRSNAQRQREKGVEFVIGRRDGPYLWDLEGTRKIIDCGTAGGVHSLGHRNRAVLGALQGALTAGHDTGLWSLPNKEQLRLQESLAALAPTPKLNRSIITLASTVSVDLAIMFSFRVTGRRRILGLSSRLPRSHRIRSLGDRIVRRRRPRLLQPAG